MLALKVFIIQQNQMPEINNLFYKNCKKSANAYLQIPILEFILK